MAESTIPLRRSMGFSANLSMPGETMSKLRQTMKGQITLRGTNLILNGHNLDQAFAKQFQAKFK